MDQAAAANGEKFRLETGHRIRISAAIARLRDVAAAESKNSRFLAITSNEPALWNSPSPLWGQNFTISSRQPVLTSKILENASLLGVGPPALSTS
jgi:hypothetical protein